MYAPCAYGSLDPVMLVDRRPCRLSKSRPQLLYFVPAAPLLSDDSERFLPPAERSPQSTAGAAKQGRPPTGSRDFGFLFKALP
jgi:hypothetical protein